ncbi:MAG: hypothetical protein K0U93_12460, partial [Gammaproteobacteria bacterium]|nr:hypothetical protein [Gammaproteobacteria bacterium]
PGSDTSYGSGESDETIDDIVTVPTIRCVVWPFYEPSGRGDAFGRRLTTPSELRQRHILKAVAERDRAKSANAVAFATLPPVAWDVGG